MNIEDFVNFVNFVNGTEIGLSWESGYERLLSDNELGYELDYETRLRRVTSSDAESMYELTLSSAQWARIMFDTAAEDEYHWDNGGHQKIRWSPESASETSHWMVTD